MAAYQSPKLLVGVRVPGGMPMFSMVIIKSLSDYFSKHYVGV